MKVGGKQKPYEMWQAGNSLAASPLANSSRASPARNMAARPPLARRAHASRELRRLSHAIKFSIRKRPLSAWGKSCISRLFRYNNGYKQRLGPLVPKQTLFSDLFSWARALKLAEKEINNGKGNSASASRFASLSEGSMQQILTERHSGKSKQITNWSVSTFKGKLKFFRFKIVKYQPRAFNRKIEIKLIAI